jgi:hypothetical protein
MANANIPTITPTMIDSTGKPGIPPTDPPLLDCEPPTVTVVVVVGAPPSEVRVETTEVVTVPVDNVNVDTTMVVDIDVVAACPPEETNWSIVESGCLKPGPP